MEGIYDSMENEIDMITRRISAVKLGERVQMIDSKLTSLSSKLIDLDFASNHVFKEGGEVMKFLESLTSLSKKLSGKGQSIHTKMSERIKGDFDKQRKFGFLTSSVMILLIIALFLFIMFKINKIIEKRTKGGIGIL